MKQKNITMYESGYNKMIEVRNHMVKNRKNARWDDVINYLYGLYQADANGSTQEHTDAVR